MIRGASDTIKLWLNEANKTHFSGCSLASTLYTFPIDIWLEGPLGAGKTTFVQGLAEGLGAGQITSPTYALEQRYQTTSGKPFIHMDLYRLNTRAAEAAASSDDHEGIRAIEWPDRLNSEPMHPVVRIKLEEEGDGRSLTVDFEDIPLPSVEQIYAWRTEMHLPVHIAAHCDAVAAFATECADHLIAEGTLVRRAALERSAMLHDLVRFVDFQQNAGPADAKDDIESLEVWKAVRAKYPGMSHEDACAAFLREQGFKEVAEIVEVHGLQMPSPDKTKLEQKILFYADKRVMFDQVVSVQERFDDFAKRYGNNAASENGRIWFEEAQRIEHELFPDGAPL